MNNYDDFKKEYKRIKRKTDFQLFLIALCISLALTAAIYYLFFHNYTVLKSSFFGIALPVPINLIESFAAGCICLTVGLILVFRKQIIKSRISDVYREKAVKQIEKENNEFTEGDKALPAGILILIIGIVAIGVLSVNCFGYNDTSIRFSDSNKIVITTAQYSDFKLYKLEGYYDDGKVLLYGDTAYGIISKNGNIKYDFGNVSKETETQLLKIYNNQYSEITTIDD